MGWVALTNQSGATLTFVHGVGFPESTAVSRMELPTAQPEPSTTHPEAPMEQSTETPDVEPPGVMDTAVPLETGAGPRAIEEAPDAVEEGPVVVDEPPAHAVKPGDRNAGTDNEEAAQPPAERLQRFFQPAAPSTPPNID